MCRAGARGRELQAGRCHALLQFTKDCWRLWLLDTIAGVLHAMHTHSRGAQRMRS